MTVYQNPEFESIEDYMQRLDFEIYSGYYFKVEKETPKGAILRCLDIPELTAFCFTSLQCGEKVLASIRKARIDNGIPRILAQVESVIYQAVA